MLDTITLEHAIKLSIPLATKIFNDKVMPIVTSKVFKFLKNKDDNSTFEKQSIKYISWATGQCSTINTIAFPNTPKKLEELYFPLTIKCEKKNKNNN